MRPKSRFEYLQKYLRRGEACARRKRRRHRRRRPKFRYELERPDQVEG